MPETEFDLDVLNIDFVSLDDKDTVKHKKAKGACNQTKLQTVLASGERPRMPETVHALAIFGSRSLVDDRVEKLMGKYVDALKAGLIVTAAEPVGVCAIAQRFARKKHIPLQIHFLQMEKYARGAWEHRSDFVIQASDAVLFIHDGKSRGTYNEIFRAVHFQKPYIYEQLEKLTADDYDFDI